MLYTHQNIVKVPCTIYQGQHYLLDRSRPGLHSLLFSYTQLLCYAVHCVLVLVFTDKLFVLKNTIPLIVSYIT